MAQIITVGELMGGRRGGRFLPTQIAGGVGWYRKGTGIVTGAGVSNWPDAFGLGHDLLQGTDAARPALQMLKARLAECAWDKAAIAAAVKQVLASTGLKMPQLAMPLRVLLTGRTQTPSIDATMELLGRETVLARLSHHLDSD